MKKFTKVCLILALVFIVMGLGCFVAGAAKGGSLIEAIKQVSGGMMDYTQDFDREIDLDNMELRESFDMAELEELQIELGYGAVVVQPVSGDSCHVWVQEQEGSKRNEVEVSRRDHSLFIRDRLYGKTMNIWDFGLNFNIGVSGRVLGLKKGCVVVVQLPKKELKRFAAFVQAGACKVYDIEAKEMEFQVECGNLYGREIQRCRSMHIEVEMGNAIFDQIECQKLDADVEMGDFNASGIKADSAEVNVEMGEINLRRVKTADFEADCEMGNIILQMEGEPSDYYIKSDVEMGDIDIEDRSSTKNKMAENKMELTCEMGDIEVSFR